MNTGKKHTSIFVEGENCWVKKTAEKISFLIDGEAYFSAFARAAEKAENFLFIAGWDIDSRLELLRGDRSGKAASKLNDLLTGLVAQKPELHVYILVWDFAMIYAFEREPLPIFKLGWRTPRNIHFHMDDEHPVGACHHQKIVVIDDEVAFAGGLDLTKRRWDTSSHALDDPRRVDPSGEPYRPFHDVQMMVEGEAARSLGALFRERWQRATGKAIADTRKTESSPWPENVAPDITGAMVAIARTEPLYRGRKETREVENLFLDSIEAVQKYLYIENQYFTAQSILKALSKRLEAEEGPEIVLVLPRKAVGWLEESTMGAIRARFLHRLRQADRHGRLKIYYPAISGLHGKFINVHAKIMIADNDFVRIGSSNLSNRSMGLDTECDLALEAGDSNEMKRSVVALLDRLLAEHLGISAGEIRKSMESTGSLIGAIESLRGRERTLEPLDEQLDPPAIRITPDIDWIDPEKPYRPEIIVENLMNGHESKSSGTYHWAGLAITAFLAIALALAWRWGPLAHVFDIESLIALGSFLRRNYLAPVFVVAAYMIGGLVVFPITILIVATALLFGPLTSLFYALLGVLASASFTYFLGHQLGRKTIRRMLGERINTLSKRVAKQGILTMAIARNLPIAPFTIVNIVAGASHVQFKDYLIGTIIGMAPGTVALTMLSDRFKAVFLHPGLTNIVILFAVALIVMLGAIVVQRFIRKKT